jgi:hypothetical protein
VGLSLYEIPSAEVIYPLDGPVTGYFHRDPVPAMPVYWLTAEMIPAVRRVIARYRTRSVGMPMTRPSSRGPRRYPRESRIGSSRHTRPHGYREA